MASRNKPEDQLSYSSPKAVTVDKDQYIILTLNILQCFALKSNYVMKGCLFCIILELRVLLAKQKSQTVFRVLLAKQKSQTVFAIELVNVIKRKII